VIESHSGQFSVITAIIHHRHMPPWAVQCFGQLNFNSASCPPWDGRVFQLLGCLINNDCERTKRLYFNMYFHCVTINDFIDQCCLYFVWLVIIIQLIKNLKVAVDLVLIYSVFMSADDGVLKQMRSGATSGLRVTDPSDLYRSREAGTGRRVGRRSRDQETPHHLLTDCVPQSDRDHQYQVRTLSYFTSNF